MENAKFNIGDVVTVNEIDYFNDYFVVVHNKVNTDNGMNYYRLMRIMPVQLADHTIIKKETDITLHTRKDSREYKLIMDFVMSDRRKQGIFDIPKFMEMINDKNNGKKEGSYTLAWDSLSNHKQKQKQDIMTETKKKSTLDVIHYNYLDKVDDCLDAINDLKRLYDMFGDEEYLNNIKIVEKRLKRLI